LSELKSILKRIPFKDAAKVQQQLNEHTRRVQARLASVRRKIFILSGKGGVGKSTVTAQLALALARQKQRVGILDADLNGPCIPRMLGLTHHKLKFKNNAAVPAVGPFGIKTASMSYLLNGKNPVHWKGPMELSPIWLGALEAGVLREFVSDIAWGNLDFLLLDLPPGAAADKPPALANLIPGLEGAVVVTTNSLVAVEVVEKSIHYAQRLHIPILGIVENMSFTLCPHCGGTLKTKHNHVQSLAQKQGLAILARIPQDEDLLESCDTGLPLAKKHPISKIFGDLAKRLIQRIPEGKKKKVEV